MKPPFSAAQFFEIFEQYHSSLFPAQWIILILGIAALLLLHFPQKQGDRFTGLLLAFLWLWAGLAYFFSFFAPFSPAGYVFGSLFLIQGLLTGYYVLASDPLSFHLSGAKSDFFGYALIAFGLFLYPLIAYLLEGSLSRTISLGLPCPTTIVTFGFFVLSSSRFPRLLLIIPSLWALIGLNAAIHFGVVQDYMMPVAALGANFLLLRRKPVPA